MPEVTIPVSLGNMKALEKQMKAFARELRSGDMATRVEQAVAVDVAHIVRAEIAGVQDVDGNYLGTSNPNASVLVEVGLPGHDVIWRGQQISFVEFGTGAAGASDPYPNPATMAMGGYHPDPTKLAWVYRDRLSGKAVLSTGLRPQAPMWMASQVIRLVDVYGSARTILRKAARDAVTV